MCSSPPVRPPKLQLAAEQPSTGECWISPKKGTPHPRAKEKPQQDGKRGETAFRIPYLPETLGGINQNLVHTRSQRPHRNRARPAFECLSVSYRGMGQQRPATGAGALGEADLRHTACGIRPFREGRH